MGFVVKKIIQKYADLRVEVKYLSVAFLYVMFAYFFNPTTFLSQISLADKDWFARSGAIMVLLAVIVEYRMGNSYIEKIKDSIFIMNVGQNLFMFLMKKNLSQKLLIYLFFWEL